MEEFFNQMGLSEESINLYLQSLGKSSLTFSELKSILPNIDLEALNSVIDELKSSGLILQVEPQKPGILMHYLPIPPISLILSYYSNIKAGLPAIVDQVKEILANTLTQMFQADESNTGAAAMVNQFQEIKNDYDEDSMLQKHDLEDVVKDIVKIEGIKDKIPNFKEIISDLHKKLKGVTQAQLARLIQLLTQIKSNISEKIQELTLKKNEAPVLAIIEETFKEQLQTMVDEFMGNLNEALDGEFENTSVPITANIEDPILEILEGSIKLKNELEALGKNFFINFDSKMDRIFKLFGNLSGIQEQIIKNLNDVIKGSLEQVSNLSNPIENTLENYLTMINASDSLKVEDLWFINSSIKFREELISIFLNSKNQINLIVPKLETYINNQQIQNLSTGLKAKIASSDPETNSIVKSLSAINTVQFTHLENENIVAASGDDSRLIIGLVQEDSQDPLKNIIGLGTDNETLINMLKPIIDTTLGAVAPSAISTPRTTTPSPAYMPSPTARPSIQPPPKPTTAPPSQEIPKTRPSVIPTSSTQPQPGDQVGGIINAAFNAVIQQLDTFKGSEFSKALQQVTDVILENKGYSVTLHNVRTWVNNYKMSRDLLTEQDKQDIKEAIESWKQRLI
jgi:hypothetical protein